MTDNKHEPANPTPIPDTHTNGTSPAESKKEPLVPQVSSSPTTTENNKNPAAAALESSPAKKPEVDPKSLSQISDLLNERDQAHHAEAEEVKAPIIGTVEVFVEVANIPKLWDEKRFLGYFKDKARVLEAIINCDPDTGRNNGTGVAKFASLSEAEDLIERLSGKTTILGASSPVQLQISGRELARLGIPGDKEASTRLRVDNLPPGLPEEELRKFLEDFGTLVEFRMSPTEMWATVKYPRTETALLARRALISTFRASTISFDEYRPLPSPAGITIRPAPSMLPNPYNPMPMISPAVYQGIGYETTGTAAGRPIAYQQPSYYPPPMAPPQSQPPAQAPLFVEYITPEGKPYYFNTVTRGTQWDRPAPQFTVVKAPGQKAESKQPSFFSSLNNMTGGEKPSGNYRRGPPGCNLFIFHLPNEWSEQELMQQFAPFGSLISARIMTDKMTGRSKGYGFVSYDNAQAAQHAVAVMNGHSVFGKRLKVELKKGDEGFDPSTASAPRGRY